VAGIIYEALPDALGAVGARRGRVCRGVRVGQHLHVPPQLEIDPNV
jgi:hypothetical protein